DIAPPMCEIAKSYAALPDYASTHTVCADIAALPFPDHCFDMVFSSLTLQWVASQQLEETLTALTRHLKPGGMLAVAIIGDGSLQELSGLDSTLTNEFIAYHQWQHIAATLPLDVYQ